MTHPTPTEMLCVVYRAIAAHNEAHPDKPVPALFNQRIERDFMKAVREKETA